VPKNAVLVFDGTCDASGAVPLSDTLFAVADDEDNVLRVYDGTVGGAPRFAIDVSGALGVPIGKKRLAPREMDLEAATRLGELAFWITSHGRTSRGAVRPERMRLFATTAPKSGEGLAVVGAAYARLLDDLAAAPALAPFDLTAAAALPPKAPGGLSIEGLAATADGWLLIGFRSPVPAGLALVVPLENPREVIAGEAARLGSPLRLDLSGQGVRALVPWRGGFLVVAGAPGDRGSTGTRLYRWDGGEAPPAPLTVDTAGLTVEAAFAPTDRGDLLVLSDDGRRVIDGVACKELGDPAHKHFRGVWIAP
jgi:hypothetical protein